MKRSLPLLCGSLVLCGPLWSQTGPGGVGSASTNVLWTVPESGVSGATGLAAGNGDRVKTWADRSGNGNNLVQSVVANQPTLTTSAINGYPTLHFASSSSQRLLVAGVSSAGTASLWAVCRYVSLPSSNPGVMQGSPSGLGFSSGTADKSIGLWVSTAGKLWGRGVQTNGTSQNLPQNASVPPNTTSIFNSIYGGSAITQYLNGTSVGSVVYDNTLRSWTDVGVGQQASEPWNGDIAEVILFKSFLGSAQRIIVDNYLAAKYGLLLSSNDLYVQDNPANGDYDHDVAGIGRISASNLQTDSRGSGIVEISGATGLDNNEFLFWGHDDGVLGTFGVGDMPSGIQGRWGRIWRVSEVTTGGTAIDVGNIDITFDLSGQGAVTPSNLRLLIDTDGDGLFSDEAPVGGAAWVSGNLYRFVGVSQITNGARFTLATTNSTVTPLPIELLSFSATIGADRTVHLHWMTGSEQNNDHFTVQRSADLAAWTDVGEVPGAGNSSSTRSYSLIDATPLGGISYYQLQQTDIDGSTTVSDRIVVQFPGGHRLAVHPNPAHGELNVGNLSSVCSAWLVDLTGTRVSTPVQLDSGHTTMPIPDIAPGNYVLVIDDGITRSTAQVALR